jgi:hypothetical protein
MANGYITPGDHGLSVNDVNTNIYVMIDARLPVQPPEWVVLAGFQRYRIQAWRQLTMDAGATTTENWIGWNFTSGASSETGALAASWKVYDGTDTDPAFPTGADLGTPAFSSASTSPRHAYSPGNNEAYLAFQSDDVDTDILAIHLEFENDGAFATSDPASTRSYETIGRNTGTWVPYADNMSVSAWLLQLLAQNLNKIMYETKQYWTVPL